MRKNLLVLLICFVTLSADAQNFYQPRYGITYVQNFATQINYNPQFPDDGKFQWSTLPASGVGVFYEQFIGKRLSLVAQGIYQVKGYRHTAQVAQSSVGLLRQIESSDKFRYLTLEINPTYHFPDEYVTPFLLPD